VLLKVGVILEAAHKGRRLLAVFGILSLLLKAWRWARVNIYIYINYSVVAS
jgi:hypothetical protein